PVLRGKTFFLVESGHGCLPFGRFTTVRAKCGVRIAQKETLVKKKTPGRHRARKIAPEARKKARKRAIEGPETLPLFSDDTMGRTGSAVIEASPAGKRSGGNKPRVSTKDAPETDEDSAPTPRRSRVSAGEYGTAESIAQKQREISVSEFFAKNRPMLGFDSPTRAILPPVKETVDNSLGACEEAGLAPDILVEIHEISENRYRLVVEDSGPGIVKQQVPKIFGKLLYGSKFHELRQSRGQQGIGISAAVMYSQLTTGQAVKITSRTGAKTKAHLYELQIDTKKNAPIVLDDGPVEWERPHGTRIDMELEAIYQKGKRSVDQYLHQVALANPHADIRFIAPKSDPVR